MFQEVARVQKKVKNSDANITLHQLLLLELPIQQNRIVTLNMKTNITNTTIYV